MAMTRENLDVPKKLMAKGQNADAYEKIKAVIEKTPDMAEAHVLLVDTAIALGDLADARRLAQVAIERFPKNPAPRLKLAQVCVAGQDIPKAIETLTEAIVTCKRVPIIDVLLVELYLDEGRKEEAINAIDAAVQAHPDNAILHIKCAQRMIRDGYMDKSAPLLRRALEIDPASAIANALYLRCLKSLGQDRELVQHVETTQKNAVKLPALYIEASRVFQRSGDFRSEEMWLERGLREMPGEPALIYYLLRRSVKRLDAESLQRLAGSALSRDQLDELRNEVMLKGADYEMMLDHLRRQKRPVRRITEAAQIGEALLWLNKRDLAKRYLRFCFRRWPDSWEIASKLLQCCIRSFNETEALELLSKTKFSNPVQQAELDMKLCSVQCGLGNLDQAMAHFHRARPMMPQIGMRNQELVRSLIGAGRWSDLDDVIATLQDPQTLGNSHLRSSLLGQLVTEYQIARATSPQQLLAAESTEFADHADTVLRHPGSTLAAMQFIGHWRAQSDTPLVPAQATKDAEVPRRIYQYWDAPEPPADISRMIESWRRANGFEHELYNRDSAVRLLRSDFGTRWVQAFRMAKTATEEADFLRLCLMARYGGVYVDTDDILNGDLAALIDCGTGAVLHLAQFGANVANNFFAACPRHPLFVTAAKNACSALLSRSNESVWQKLGPGLMTRLTARYVAQQIKAGKPVDLAVLTSREVGRSIAPHNQTSQKLMGGHWNSKRARSADYVGLLEKSIGQSA